MAYLRYDTAPGGTGNGFLRDRKEIHSKEGQVLRCTSLRRYAALPLLEGSIR